jgi:hypothetical protein
VQFQGSTDLEVEVEVVERRELPQTDRRMKEKAREGAFCSNGRETGTGEGPKGGALVLTHR